MAASDIVRILRIIEYVGDRESVEHNVARAIHGTKVIFQHRDRSLIITAASLHEFGQAVATRESVLIEQINRLQVINEDLQAEIEGYKDVMVKTREIVRDVCENFQDWGQEAKVEVALTKITERIP